MAWRITETPDGENPQDLTDSEMIGVVVLVRENMREPYDQRNVYYRAWEKLRALAAQANARLDEDAEEDENAEG